MTTSQDGTPSMHVFIPLFFTAPLGGLQAHVRRHVEALLRSGHQATLMCKPGPFAQSSRELDVPVLETGFDEMPTDAVLADQAGRYDLVHAHPFRASEVGLEVARRQRIPFIVTFHGTYLERLPDYTDDVDLLIAVSPAVRDFLLQRQAIHPSRAIVVPNGVDRRIFRPSEPDWEGLRQVVPALRDAEPSANERRLLFVSRLDPDKQFMLDVVLETWTEAERARAFDLVWWVAGDGTLRSQMEAAAEALNHRAGRRLVTFLGWQDEPTLSSLYNACHLAVAPGRSALESMACGKPVIAMGSKGYVGLTDSATILAAAYGNFGGYGLKHEGYTAGAMFRDIDRVIYDDHALSSLGELSRTVVEAFFDQEELDRTILRIYEVVSALTPRHLTRAVEDPPTPPELLFADEEQPDHLARTWAYLDDPTRSIELTPNQQLVVRYAMAEGDKFYMHAPPGSFDRPPADALTWRLDADQTYRLRIPFKAAEGTPHVMAWLIEYEREARLKHTTWVLSNGDNLFAARTSPHTTCFRIALRFAGSGTVLLGPIGLGREALAVSPTVPPPDEITRSKQVGEFHAYEGENLVFVVGPPRSGTTWVLNLLRNHPDVVAATVENLEARVNDQPTLETNIFNDSRPFTDMQIKRKFHLLSQAHPGKVIVEKTPVHLLFVERIRRIFPQCALVLTARDGRDVATSLMHVGRDPGAWWQGAPDTIEKAATLWRKYAEASLDCAERDAPYVLRYEELLADPEGELTRLQSALGLTNQSCSAQVEASRGGKGIPISGVFREGSAGGWRKLFTDEDILAFKRIAGDLLIRLGYETDDDWSG